MQMNYVLLSALNLGDEHQCIRVRASRVFYHRTGLEDGELKEIRTVLVDEAGNSIYAIVPTELVPDNIDRLHETGIFELMFFEVSAQDITMKPVTNPMVITFTGKTNVQLILDPNDVFPQWTYNLTSVSNLPLPNNTPSQFVDVLGVIRGISSAATLNLRGRNCLATRRHVMLADASGDVIKITLWGESAIHFNGAVIRFLGQHESAVVIFVGLTVQLNEGRKELAGSATSTRWYINEDIPEINVMRVGVKSSFRPIAQLPAPREMNLRTPVEGRYPTKTINMLLNDDLDGLYRCTVKIWRITPGNPWWFAACNDCGRASTPVASLPTQPAIYRCSRPQCQCPYASLEYRLHLLGSDPTGEAEFTLIGRVAQNIIGLSPYQAVLNNYQGNDPITNLAVAASQITHTPPQLAAVVSWKYQFLIHRGPHDVQGEWPNFNVRMVEAAYPPE